MPEITMPQLSDTMTEGTVVKWHKREGEKVKEGDKIADVETDKAVMEMESFETGILSKILVKEGEKVQVGAPLAIVAGAGEKVEPPQKSASHPPQRENKPPAPKPPAPKPLAQKPPPQAQRPQDDEDESADTEMGYAPIEDGRAQSRRELVLDGPEHTAEAMSREASEHISKQRGAAPAAPTEAKPRQPR